MTPLNWWLARVAFRNQDLNYGMLWLRKVTVLAEKFCLLKLLVYRKHRWYLQGTGECAWTYLKRVNKDVRYVDVAKNIIYIQGGVIYAQIIINVDILLHVGRRQNVWILYIFDICNPFLVRQDPVTWW